MPFPRKREFILKRLTLYKNTNQRFTGYCFLAALLLHTLLVLLVGYNFNWWHKNISASTKPEQKIHAYLYRDKVNAAKQIKTITPHQHQPTPTTAHKTFEQTSSAKPQIPKTPASSKPATNNQAISGAQMDALITLLHAAIQAQQVYPPSALDLGRFGRVSVSFTLQPNGNITDLTLVHSSGTDSLDQAGLAAVRNAAPFQGVSQYVQQSKVFQIDVVFELPQEG